MGNVTQAFLEADISVEHRLIGELNNLKSEDVLKRLPTTIRWLVEDIVVDWRVYQWDFLEQLHIVVSHETSITVSPELSWIRSLFDEVLWTI